MMEKRPDIHHWCSDCHGLTEEVLKASQTTRDMEQCLISRLEDLQCLPSYLYTCVGNQIRQSQKEPFHTASSPSLVLAHHSLSICLHLYDVVGPALRLMWMCRVDESHV